MKGQLQAVITTEGLLKIGNVTASPRAVARAVHGAWAKVAAEPTPRGLHAFMELVPRDHETQSRWTVAAHHWEWQSAAFIHDRLNIIAPIEHGKTEQMTFARTAWEIGCDPSLRHVLVQNTADQAVKTARAIRELIESNADYHRVFPHVTPGYPWTDRAFTVARPNMADRNPTLQATGLYGPILGARVDRAKFDDIEDFESTRTPKARRKTQEWLRITVLSRLTRRARLINVETAWHPEDLAHTFRKDGMPTIVHRIRRIDGSYLWQSRWDTERERKKRRELGPLAAARMLDAIARADELGRFKEAWVQKALKNGEGKPFYPSVRPDNGSTIVVGVDLAVGRGEDHDLTAFATVLADAKGRRYLLNMESGRWSGPDIVARIIQHSRRYPGAIILVENNGAQDYIRQFAADEVASIVPYTTGASKADPRFGVEAIATELWNGAWTIPCDSVSDGQPMTIDAHPEVMGLLEDMFDYTPSGHTGDRLMALFLAREGLCRGASVVENVQLWD